MADSDSNRALCEGVPDKNEQATGSTQEVEDAVGHMLSPQLETANILSCNEILPATTQPCSAKGIGEITTKASEEKLEESSLQNSGRCSEDDGCAPEEVETKLKEPVSSRCDATVEHPLDHIKSRESTDNESSWSTNYVGVTSLLQRESCDRMDTSEEGLSSDGDKVTVAVRHETRSCDVNIPSPCSLSHSRVSSVQDNVVTASCMQNTNDGTACVERGPMETDEVQPSTVDELKKSDEEERFFMEVDAKSPNQEIANSEHCSKEVVIVEDFPNATRVCGDVLSAESGSRNQQTVSGQSIESVSESTTIELQNAPVEIKLKNTDDVEESSLRIDSSGAKSAEVCCTAEQNIAADLHDSQQQESKDIVKPNDFVSKDLEKTLEVSVLPENMEVTSETCSLNMNSNVLMTKPVSEDEDGSPASRVESHNSTATELEVEELASSVPDIEPDLPKSNDAFQCKTSETITELEDKIVGNSAKDSTNEEENKDKVLTVIQENATENSEHKTPDVEFSVHAIEDSKPVSPTTDVACKENFDQPESKLERIEIVHEENENATETVAGGKDGVVVSELNVDRMEITSEGNGNSDAVQPEDPAEVDTYQGEMSAGIACAEKEYTGNAESEVVHSSAEDPSQKCDHNAQDVSNDGSSAAQDERKPTEITVLESCKSENVADAESTKEHNGAESDPLRENPVEGESVDLEKIAVQEAEQTTDVHIEEVDSNAADVVSGSEHGDMTVSSDEMKTTRISTQIEGNAVATRDVLEVAVDVVEMNPVAASGGESEVAPMEVDSEPLVTCDSKVEDAKMEVEPNPDDNSSNIEKQSAVSGCESEVASMDVDAEFEDPKVISTEFSSDQVESTAADVEKTRVGDTTVAPSQPEMKDDVNDVEKLDPDSEMAAIPSQHTTPISKYDSDISDTSVQRENAAETSIDIKHSIGDLVPDNVSRSECDASAIEEKANEHATESCSLKLNPSKEDPQSGSAQMTLEEDELVHRKETECDDGGELNCQADEDKLASEDEVKCTVDMKPVAEERDPAQEMRSNDKDEELETTDVARSDQDETEPEPAEQPKSTDVMEPSSVPVEVIDNTEAKECAADDSQSKEENMKSPSEDLQCADEVTKSNEEQVKSVAEDIKPSTDDGKSTADDVQSTVEEVKLDSVELVTSDSSVVDSKSTVEQQLPPDNIQEAPADAKVAEAKIVAGAGGRSGETYVVPLELNLNSGEVEILHSGCLAKAVASSAKESEGASCVAQQDVIEVDDRDADNQENKEFVEDFGMQGITILDVRSVTEEELLLPSLQEEDGDKMEIVQIDDSDTRSQKDEMEVEDESVSVMSDPDNPSALDSENAGIVNAENSSKEPRDTGESGAEPKCNPSNTSAKMKAAVVGKTCTVCEKTKSCKYQVLMQGATKFVCSDECFREFGSKQKITKSIVSQFVSENRPVTRSVTKPRELCHICMKEIKNGMGLLAGVGEHKPLCSEDCMKKYQANQGLKRACAQCGGTIQGRNRCLTWETMEFCNEECLGKYQSFLGSNCACCHTSVQRTSLGKYCVRFGSDIKQFCSNKCLEEFKKVLKVCSFCQKDISRSSEAFIAPIGEKGQFKEFCSQTCMEKFETMGAVTPAQPSIQQCSVCNKMAQVKVEFVFEGKSHRLCSESCVAAFRYANKINTSICDSCHKFFDLDVSHQLTIQFEGSCKRFCSKTCTNVFVLYRRKVVPCTWCKVKKYNFDMIERVDSNNHVQLFCSLNCLSLFRVSLNATSSKSVRCDFCRQLQPAQYHLTMSDASIRNFCSYNCVMQFQNQFTSITPVLPPQPLTQTSSEATIVSSTLPRATTAVSTATNTAEAGNSTTDSQQGTPIISSVVSLAPSGQQSNSSSTTSTSAESPSPGGTATVSSASRLPVLACKPVTKTMASQTHVSQSLPVSQRVFVKNPSPKLQKNKAILCKPLMQTKGVSCKPHPCHKSVQTDAVKPVIIPLPVPIYIPVPMHMYTTPVPYPLPFPIPIPVPIFLHKPKDLVDKNRHQFDDTDNDLTVTEMTSERERAVEISPVNSWDTVCQTKDTVSVEAKRVTEVADLAGPPPRKRSSRHVSKRPKLDVQSPTLLDSDNRLQKDTEIPEFGIKPANEGVAISIRPPELQKTVEDVIPKAVCNKTTKSTVLPIIQVATPQALTFAEISPKDTRKGSWDENGDSMSPRQLRTRTRVQKRSTPRLGGRGRGRKKARVEMESSEGLSTDEDNNSRGDAVAVDENSQIMVMTDANMTLKYTYGVNAWKYWVLQKNMQLEKASQTNRKLKLFKTELLQLTPDELNYSLCLFVKEARKPNGEEYAPDCVYYLCLGIQQYLFENSRIDNIFTDTSFEKFTECLNEVLQRYEITFNSEGLMLRRIDEEILWECKQLGAHSPHVLLNTLMFFNSKYFLLKSVDDHTHLSFTQIMRHCKKLARNLTESDLAKVVKVSSPIAAASPFEHFENMDNPLRCPVKLYEFYLSKCPESIKNRSDVFYLHPERACVPDSPVWYSTQALGRETVTKMLQRIKMVREIALTKDL